MSKQLMQWLAHKGRTSGPEMGLSSFSRKQLKRMRPKRYKPAFTMGHRGFAKSYTRPRLVPAPTIDQVRRLERKYGQKLHVKAGLLFFASDGAMFTKADARERAA